MPRLEKKVKSCDDPRRSGDVVFVHGLSGDATTTWRPDFAPNRTIFDWLGENLPNVGVWSLDYDAYPSSWKGNGMPLDLRTPSHSYDVSHLPTTPL